MMTDTFIGRKPIYENLQSMNARILRFRWSGEETFRKSSATPESRTVSWTSSATGPSLVDMKRTSEATSWRKRPRKEYTIYSRRSCWPYANSSEQGCSGPRYSWCSDRSCFWLCNLFSGPNQSPELFYSRSGFLSRPFGVFAAASPAHSGQFGDSVARRFWQSPVCQSLPAGAEQAFPVSVLR